MIDPPVALRATALAGWRRIAGRRDAALAGALCALGELELFGGEKYNGRPVWPGPVGVNAVLIVALTAPFVWRRRRPLGAVLATFAVMTASTLILGGAEAATTFIVLIAAAFSGAAYSRHLVIVIVAAVIASVAHGINDPSSEGLADLTWTYGLVAVAALIGRAVWVRQHRIGSLENDAASAEDRHLREIAAATAAERATIARELHDIVSHAVSVIVIQAQVGSRALPSELEVVGESLSAIEGTARGAMSELRQLLTLLATDDEAASVAPIASLRQVAQLLDQCRAAGMTIDADIDETVGPLPPVADLAAYRLIQEALTNTMRHAPGAKAHIRVRRHGEMIELLAQDSGGDPVSPSGPPAGSGRGLIGMRERLALAGGHLVEAAHGATGFRVRALIPAGDHPQPPAERVS
ncbi:sensor histidine kinase [Allobranchiibius huperziae]|uniref:histidine kinase n=1 Tax=Allobranchiibius huperziae TaxID=1874116 RepID=A0A853DEZ5_9MICO|nr:histidine kinase [Allobranchiibius huperziae]NYJ73634.1 signal transduction histidine kinase [Allobranchiibius huperziae]